MPDQDRKIADKKTAVDVVRRYRATHRNPELRSLIAKAIGRPCSATYLNRTLRDALLIGCYTVKTVDERRHRYSRPKPVAAVPAEPAPAPVPTAVPRAGSRPGAVSARLCADVALAEARARRRREAREAIAC